MKLAFWTTAFFLVTTSVFAASTPADFVGTYNLTDGGNSMSNAECGKFVKISSNGSTMAYKDNMGADDTFSTLVEGVVNGGYGPNTTSYNGYFHETDRYSVTLTDDVLTFNNAYHMRIGIIRGTERVDSIAISPTATKDIFKTDVKYMGDTNTCTYVKVQ